ncbi:myotubularin-related protein 13-like [Branchiostoma floridae x Branchiostoma belcheri]
MARLADYFIVVGFDHNKERGIGTGRGKILQRFPTTDWEDVTFHQGIELFCQPGGWNLSMQRRPPAFFVATLTDMDAERHYCACLSFMEPVEVQPNQPDDQESEEEEEEGVENGERPKQTLMFAPKSLVLVSRLQHFETFRHCLGILYTVYIENQSVQIETLVGNILGSVHVPPPGGPQVRFSIGAGDRQALQPPLSDSLPVTGTTVAMLFRQLGIYNVICLFCAALTDHKILFHSTSYSRMSDACQALCALMFPIKYSYVYIPVLPAFLKEVLSTPTPFIIGVHASLKNEMADLLDVIIADLDGGCLTVPDCISLSLLPEPLLSRTKLALSMVLHPDLHVSDHAFPPESTAPSPLPMLDKEIRAIFLRLIAELFFGYRGCLTLIRIHPEPVITFHKATFLSQRGLIDDDFLTKVLDGMSFRPFVHERGPPYRPCDIFDELVSGITTVVRDEGADNKRVMKNVHELARQLYLNENPSPQPYVEKIPKASEAAHSRLPQPQFPVLSEFLVQQVIEDAQAKRALTAPKMTSLRVQQPRIVPCGENRRDKYAGLNSSARRLEVMRNCINYIFDNKIQEAKKSFPAVLRGLKSKVTRLALCDELSLHMQQNRVVLENQQFDMVVRLINCALQDCSSMDEHGVAAGLLPLVCAFCRKLAPGVMQFAYTLVQDHPVWTNLQFWEASFYTDIQKHIKELYYQPDRNGSAKDPHELEVPSSPGMRRRSEVNRSLEKSALDIAAEQLRLWPHRSKEDQQELVNNEESTVYSQAIHYANRMVFMLVPLDTSKGIRVNMGNEPESGSNSNVTSSIGGSDSFDAESAQYGEEDSDMTGSVCRFITRFVDKVCTESGVTPDHIKALHAMVPGVTAMHVDSMEQVCRESKRLPPIQKPKILRPELLPGEDIVMEGLRSYLIPDGREEGTGGSMGGPALLPAEGAVFLTTYRTIFKGIPCDPLASEQIVVRSFPVASLTREKKINVQYLSHINEWLSEGLQLRACTFQLVKLAFDEEVTSEDIETFRKLINRLRYPVGVQEMFALSRHHVGPRTMIQKHKEKNATLNNISGGMLLETTSFRDYAFLSRSDFHDLQDEDTGATVSPYMPRASSERHIDAIPGRRSMYGTKDWRIGQHSRALSKTLGKGAKKAGKQIAKRTKYMLPTDSIFMAKVDGDVRKAASLDELASDDAESRPSEKLSLERLKEQAAYRDYVRLGLGSLNGSQARQKTEPFRISQANVKYSTCRSYPALIVVPQSVSDESVRKVARCYRQSRLPVVTWRHPRTRAVLMRSGGFHGKGVMGVLKSAQKSAQLVQAPQSGGSSDTSSSVEQEQYFSALVSATPASRSGTLRQLDLSPSESLTSLFTVRTSDQSDPSTPDSQRKEAANRKLAPVRQGSGKSSNSSISSIRSGFSRQWSSFRHSVHPNKGFKHWNSLRSSGRASSGSQIDTGLRLAFENGALSKDSGISNGSIQNMHGSVLYAFGEKSQMKGVKADQFPKCDFIPVDFVEVRHMKASFKKLMRACVPSAPFTDPNMGFLKAVEESEWLQQISHLLQLSGAAVDLLDMQGASVLISLEDGWDVTTQVVSLAQVLLDPYYRTVDGFRVLVEKEWLAFGHRFSHRCNHTQASQGSGFAPVFLQFLDAVHQVLHQFPLSFEFNSYYLKLLAFHSVSGRFKSLLMDSEYERLEAGLLTDKDKHKGVHGDDPTGSLKGAAKDSGKHAQSRTIWDYISQLHTSSPLLYNVNYQPQQESPVLRPYSCISSLRIWDYFLEEDLSSGQSYDRELMALAVQCNRSGGPSRPDRRRHSRQHAEEVPEEQLSPVSNRIIVSACYDNINQHQPNILEWLLKESRDLEQELGHLPLKWRFLWDKLEDNSCTPRPRKPSVSTQLVRAHGISTHKRATIEVLIKGKLSTGAEKAFTHPHRFEMASFPTPTYCDFCSQMLWGIAKQGLRCADCGYSCHERCREMVPKHCRRVRALADGGVGGSMVRLDSESDISKASSTSMVIQGPSDGTLYDQFSSASEEHSIHEGYLYKRGALLKGWKQRWFVLDSNKHQLRYYDAIHDQHCKGFIDLSEVVSVTLSTPLPGAPKKTEDRTFFDLRTVRRVYNFLSSDRQTAQEWIDKIQSCISS